jgi:ComEC/Rec2-related protein
LNNYYGYRLHWVTTEWRYVFRHWFSQTQASWGFFLLALIVMQAVSLYFPSYKNDYLLWGSVAFLSAVGLLIFGWAKRLPDARFLLIQLTILTLGLMLGAWLAIIQWQKIDSTLLPLAYQNQWVTVKGTLWPDDQGWQLATAWINQQPHRTNLSLGNKLQFPTDAIGAKVVVAGLLKLPAAPRFAGDFDDWHFRVGKHQGGTLLRPQVYRHYGRAYLTLWEEIEASVLASVHHIRNRVGAIFKQTLGEEAGSLLGGVVLGDRAIQLPPATKAAFLQTGQIHLVAASGMNIAFVAGCMGLLLAFLPQKPFRLLKFGFVSVGVGFYALLTGLPPSIKRAATMWQLGLWVRGVNHHIHALNLLLLAIAFLCLLDGVCLFSVGFQLSVLTTLGIIAYTPLLERWGQRLHLPNWLGLAVMVTVAAQLWANPLILYYFHQIPLHATVFNTISSVLVAPITMLGFLGTLGLGLHEGITQVCAWLCTWGLRFMLLVTHWGAGFTNAVFHLKEPLPTSWLLYSYGLLFTPILWRITQARVLFSTASKIKLQLPASLAYRLVGGTVLTVMVILPLVLLASPLFSLMMKTQQQQRVSSIVTKTTGTAATTTTTAALAANPLPQKALRSVVYFVPLSASKSVYLWQFMGQPSQTIAVLPAQFSAKDAQAVSAFLFQKKVPLPKLAFVLNAPPRKKKRPTAKQEANHPLGAGLAVARQHWGLTTLYSADSVALKRLFSGRTVGVGLGSKTQMPLATLDTKLWLTPYWCSHSKKERWQVCLLATEGNHITVGLGNKPARQTVAWQKPANNLYQAIGISSRGIEILE